MIRKIAVRTPLGRDDVTSVLDRLDMTARIDERRAAGLSQTRADELVHAVDTCLPVCLPVRIHADQSGCAGEQATDRQAGQATGDTP